MTVIANWGDEKTAKSTFAISAPKPIFHCDFDLGIERAYGIKLVEQNVNGKVIKVDLDMEVESTPYAMPFQLGGKINGVKELWNTFLADYVKVLENQKLYQDKTPFRSIILDTGTQEYEVCRFGYLQEKQEVQLARGLRPGEDLRESLLSVEYAEPYARLKTLIYGARSYKKNLMITHYSTDEYAQRLGKDGRQEDYKTGKLRLDGFKYTEGLADLVLYNYRKEVIIDKIPVTQLWGLITLSGLDIRMEGMTFQNPSYDSIIKALKMYRGEE